MKASAASGDDGVANLGKTKPVSSSFLEWLRDTRNCRPATLHSYGVTLDALDRFFPDPLLAETIGLESFVRRPRSKGQPYGAPATRAKDVAVLRSFYEWCHRRGYIEPRCCCASQQHGEPSRCANWRSVDPTLDLAVPKVPHAQPRPIPDDVFLSHWLSEELHWRARLVLGLAFFCGLRRSEVLAIAPHHVDLEGRRFVAFARKGGGDDIFPWGDVLDVFERRMPHLQPGRFEPLLRWAADRDDAPSLIWSPRYVSNDGSNLNVFLSRHYKGFTLHQGRHSFCTNLLRCGLPLHLVQRLANHSSPTTTMGYVKAGGQEVKEWLRAN